ncbi:MAG: hypothetical protein A3F12_06090 [Gammaproteobacteria bacterium RIFCSPHIGHO2_12_FULL_38_14]|nr:MAG: hypothetical protein A3F12_06090 [Gammaproteobacteria bacterium RIFCSPHIGHO2_12_FULL_38_14]
MQMKHNVVKIGLLLSLIFSIGWFSSPLFAVSTRPPLEANQAFGLSLSFQHPHELFVQWQIAEGYYLYAKRMHISFTGPITSEIIWPQGDLRFDPEGKRYEAYSGAVSIPIKLKSDASRVDMRIDYQGCSQDGFCYPPMQQYFSLNLKALTITEGNPPSTLSTLMTNQNDVNHFLQTSHFLMSILLFVGLGLLLAFTPCVLPMVPILASIIAGEQSIKTKRAFLLSLSYVLGMAVVYAIMGIFAAFIGQSMQVWLQQPLAIFIVSGLFILLALSLFGLFDIPLLSRLQNRMNHLNQPLRGGYFINVFMMGMLSTLIVSPCVTAPFVGVLMYIGATGNGLFGAAALFAMGIGMGIPLLLLGTSAGRWLPKSGEWMILIKKLFGIMMFGMAIWLISRAIPSFASMILWNLLLLGIAIFIGFDLPRFLGRPFIYRGLGVVVGSLGIFMLFSGSLGLHFANATFSSHAEGSPFIVVHDMLSLHQQLNIAKSTKKPVILDFYADWCESCVTMEKQVFSDANVKLHLKPYILLRADLSNNTSADEALMKSFNVIAPPTVLFFNLAGDELVNDRIIGEVSANEFLIRLQKISGSH